MSKVKYRMSDPADVIKSWHYNGKHPITNYRDRAKNSLASWMAEQMDKTIMETLGGEDYVRKQGQKGCILDG